MNLAGIKASADTGELALNKTAKTLREVAKIDIYADEKSGQLKEMTQIMDELASKWDSFTDVERAGLAESIAGKNQAAVFQSLMSNFDKVKQVQAELSNGDHFGSMFEENAQYIDSISGKLNTLKETWVGIFNTIFSSDATKGLLDGLIAISEAIATVITKLDEVGMLTPMLTGLGVLLASKAFTGIGSLFNSGTTSAIGFSRVLPGLISGLGNMNPPATAIGASMVGLGTNLAAAGTAVGGFLATAASFIPWAIAGAAVVGGLAWAYDAFTESLDEEKQRLDETVNARKQEIASIEEQKGKLQGLQEEYDKLSNKPEKTSKEVERLTELTKQLAEIRPDLVVGYDETGNPILSMTGDVKDLITEMDRATESKKRLLSVEQEDSAKNSIKQLHGDNKGSYSDVNGYSNNANSEMGKLESITANHVMNMNKLEKDRDKIINKLYEATGKERQKLLKDLDKANYNIEKAQNDFTQSYQQQLDVIKEYSDKIGDGIFSGLEQSSIFKGMDEKAQKQFSSLKSSLDFSDIKTEDQLLEVEMSLNNLLKAAANGDVDLGKLKTSLENANKEFAKTGDAEKYSQAIDDIITNLEKATGQDFSMLKDVFEGMDTTILKGKDALDEFLRAYGKTKADLNNKNDGFAKALAEQKRQIEDAINNLEITGKPNVDIEIAHDLMNNMDLPEQLRDMIRTMINSGVDGTEILKVTQAILLDIQDGKIDNPEKLQQMIDEAFGEEGRFEITPEILMSNKTKVAGVEEVVRRITEKFGEIPPVVKTIIEAEGITAYSEARRLTETYLGIPEEVRTVMTNNGMESMEDVQMVDLMLRTLPTEVATNILTNYPDVVSDAGSLKDLIMSLPPSVLMEIKNNYPEVVQQSGLLQDAINNLPATKESKISVTEEIKKDPMSLLDKLFGKDKTAMTATAVINSQVNNLDALKEFSDLWSGITGGGFGGGSSLGGSGKSVEEYALNPLGEDLSQLSRAAKGVSSGGSGGSGFDATINVTVNGIELIQQLQDVMSNLVLNDISATITVNTSLAANNISGLLVRIDQVKSALGTLSSKDVSINTELSAKNLSGLITRVQQYTSAINGVTTKAVDIATATAAKNVSGLIRKINEYNGVKPKPLTFTTNASSVRSQVQSLANSVKNVPSSKSIKFNISQSGSIPSGASTFGLSTNEDVVKTYNLTPEVIDATGVDTSQISTLSDESNILSRATIKTPIDVTGKNVKDSLKYSVELLKELENRIQMVGSQLSILDKKMAKAIGSEKIKYLEQQNVLYKEQLTLQKELEVKLKQQQSHSKNFLQASGFQFTNDGNLKNYEEKLIAMEKEAERLSEIAGRDKSSDKQRKASEDYNKVLDETKKYLQQYLDVTFNELPKVQEEYLDINDSIQENIDSIKKLKIEQANYTKNTKLKEVAMLQDVIADKQELINEKMQFASGQDKIKYQQELISLLKEEQKLQQDKIKQYEDSLKAYQKELSGFGMTFDENGTIKNLDEILNLNQNSQELEYLNELIEEYFDIQRDELPDARKEWEKNKNEIKENEQAVKNLKQEIKDLNSDSGYKDHERDISETQNKLDKNKILQENATYEEKLKLMEEEIELTKKLQKENQDLLQYEKNKRSENMSELGKYGFQFRDDGSIVGYGNKIAALKEKLPTEEFDKMFSMVEEYLKATNETIPELENGWHEFNNEIKNTSKEVEKLKEELKELQEDSLYKDHERDLAEVNNALKKNQTLLENSKGSERVELLQERINLLNKLKKETQELTDFERQRRKVLMTDLGEYGFKFRDDGSIEGYGNVIANLKKTLSDDEFEKVFAKIEEYLKSTNETIPDLENDYLELGNSIEDVIKDITSVYKEEVEKRKKLIDEELKKRLDALDKEKKAYNDSRQEADYKNDYNEQMDVIDKLQNKIDIASKDTSLSGKKKLEELLNQMKEEQKKLQDMVQDKIDSDINDMFDKESDRLQEESDKAKEELDEKYSDEKLQQIVKDALTNGAFVDLDGNIRGLQDKLNEFKDTFGKSMISVGDSIESELISGLKDARSLMEDLNDIMQGLDFDSIVKDSLLFGEDIKSFNPNNYTTAINNTIQFNSPLINVEGNVAEDTIPELKKIIKQAEKEITKNIVKAIK